ncbi:MAG: hypothetical protein KatS3mg123_0107 [Burkholderiales bacterium]|nr:MAG: hypothetical protein KatS3mg123_0107 [Burkholderiales bacterium]
MSEGWKRLDLEGGGLQAANLKLSRLLKRRQRAYALLLLAPLGLHRTYLEEPRGAWVFRGLGLAAAVGFAAGIPYFGWAALSLLAGFAAHDIVWIEGRVARLNKALRMKVYLGQTPGAPAGFRGRFPDEDAAGSPPGETDLPLAPDGRARSFAEQEALLRALARRSRHQEASPPPSREPPPSPSAGERKK